MVHLPATALTSGMPDSMHGRPSAIDANASSDPHSWRGIDSAPGSAVLSHVAFGLSASWFRSGIFSPGSSAPGRRGSVREPPTSTSSSRSSQPCRCVAAKTPRTNFAGATPSSLEILTSPSSPSSPGGYAALHARNPLNPANACSRRAHSCMQPSQFAPRARRVGACARVVQYRVRACVGPTVGTPRSSSRTNRIERRVASYCTY